MRLELRDARCFFENDPAVIRLAGKNLGDMPLGQDAIARAAHTRTHEKLLDVLETAGDLVQEILARPIAEDAARQRHFVIRHLHARRAQATSPAAPPRTGGER